jgi:hypothetical protein
MHLNYLFGDFIQCILIIYKEFLYTCGRVKKESTLQVQYMLAQFKDKIKIFFLLISRLFL